MKESNGLLLTIAKIIVFVLSVGLVIYGQRTVGHFNLFLQLIGLSGLLFLLWNYNRKFI